MIVKVYGNCKVVTASKKHCNYPLNKYCILNIQTTSVSNAKYDKK